MADGAAGSLGRIPPVLSGADVPDSLSHAGRRHFLFISAPFGPFAKELAHRLEAEGAACTRVILNAGDFLDWGWRPAKVYLGPRARWSDWLVGLIKQARITDLISYGDSSPFSVDAVRLAAKLQLPVHVFEQGYFRPDWVTLEAGGVNANSKLPRDPAWYRGHPESHCTAEWVRIGKTTPTAIWHIVRYHAALYAGLPVFFRYRLHYQHSALSQAASHLTRAVVRALSRRRRRVLQQSLVSSGRPLYLALLQRPGDSQLWRHSDFERVEPFLDRVVESFARCAPETAFLLIRPHPFDHGLDTHERVLERLAHRYGVSGRTHLVDHGKLHEILPAMSGAVCVNSTAGLAAVEFGCPTVVLGRAIYDMPGLTHQGGLDRFWRHAEPPDSVLYLAFRNVVMARTQINGAYATKRGRKLATLGAARRLMSPVSGKVREVPARFGE